MSKTYVTLNDFEMWELEAFADGESLPHVAAFVAHHAEAWVAWQQQNGQALPFTPLLFRFDCPTTDQLRDYLWQDLGGMQRAQIDGHLAACSHCSAELATLRQLVLTTPSTVTQVTAPQANLAQRLHAWWQNAADHFQLAVAQLVTPAPGVALQALRSDTRATPILLYETAGVDISLMIKQDGGNGHQLAGQLYTADAVAAGTFQLWHATSATMKEGKIDENGTFHIAELTTGDYQLILRLATQTVVIPTLNL